jgi:hypothetical protein
MKTPRGVWRGGGLLSVSESPLPLLYVLLDSCRHLWHRLCGIVKNSPVSLLPNIPKCVDHYPIESSAFSGWHFICRFMPPSSDVDGSPWGCDCNTLKFSQERIWSQTTFANGQHKQRCRPVSKGPLQSTQWSWCGHPLFCRFCAMRILSCTRIQAKILHLFFAWAFQIMLARKNQKEPWNWVQ